MFYSFLRNCAKLFYIIVYHIVVIGRENIPPQKGGYIIASNHVSNNDPPVIGVTFKGKYTFMAKQELFEKNFLFTWLIKCLGAFPVKRGAKDNAAIERALESLNEGRIFVIFPEGTRSKDGKVGKGKTGVAMIAAKSGADVVPCGIVFEGEKLHFRSKLTLKFGKPIKAEELAVEGNSPRELKEVKKRIMGAITELVEGPALTAADAPLQLEDKNDAAQD